MFNRLKKRVKDVQDNRGKTRPGEFQPPQGRSVATDAAYGLATAAKVALEKHAIRNGAPGLGRLTADEQAHHFVDPLVSFHGCIEAADALAAASGHESKIMPARFDEATGLTDCSVLVSPDGDLLLIPQGADQRNILLKRRRSRLASSGEMDGIGDASIDSASSSRSMFTELMLNGKDDYESAVFLGNDLHADGDKALNGFSSRGWSIPATTAALQQTEQSLRDFSQFCEDMVLSRKEFAAKTSDSCDKLRVNHPSLGGHAPSVHPVDSDWEIVDPRSSDFVMTPGRVGPLLFPGSSLCQATIALENYYSSTAESESQRWRMASLQRKGVLPSIRHAQQVFEERCKKRQQALDGASQQARRMEDRLNRLKTLSEQSWEAVYESERRVTRRMEELMTERSRVRERGRLEKLKLEEEKRMTDTKEGSLGTTTEEIWAIVSEVAGSMDDGSFEPMDLPSAPVSIPLDKSKSVGQHDSVPISEVAESSDGTKALPIASREQIEQELRLPELRSTAMAADEAVADAADALMNMLSNLDTARRSAKVSAETNLISACNAQAVCLRSLVKLERQSLEERLKALIVVEEVIDSIEPRADLDMYIEADKGECGGASHLGDDDDGGIAAALAILSRHVEGNLGSDSLSRNVSDSSMTGNHSDGFDTGKIEDALEEIFVENAYLQPDHPSSDGKDSAQEHFLKTIDFLCKTAKEMGSSARTQRSKICYFLNSKRGSNAEILSPIQFEGLCRLFSAVLTGCNNEGGGITNAKMCIMLASTFYLAAAGNPQTLINEEGESRDRREFVRNRLRDHPMWKKEDFWDEAFGQQITESLTHSGVMANFDKDKRVSSHDAKSEWFQHRKITWHDLTQMERVDAAAQVHAIVFAQLGALAHSKIELGCGLERSAAFVRRMAIRHQIPMSQRAMLLQHLMTRDNIEQQETGADVSMLSITPNVSIDEGDASDADAEE